MVALKLDYDYEVDYYSAAKTTVFSTVILHIKLITSFVIFTFYG